MRSVRGRDLEKMVELGLLLAGVALLVGGEQRAVAEEPAAVSSEQQPSTRPVERRHWLRVTGSRVNLRSRPDLNSRIVGQVKEGDLLEALGSVYNWCKLVPPEGVYSLVAGDYIERIGGSCGIVRVDTTLRVRVGSDLQPRDPLQSEVQARLGSGSELQILGELDDRWLKVVPPKGVFVYISGDFVEEVAAEEAERLASLRTSPESQPVLEATSRSASASGRVPASRPAADPTPTAGQKAPTEETPEALPDERYAPGGRLKFDARGILRPCFALPAGPYGLRYQLEKPFTGEIRAYVEFPADFSVEPAACLGRYVGVCGKSQAIDELGVSVLRASRVTVLDLQRAKSTTTREKR